MGATRGKKARETNFRWLVLLMLCVAIYSFVYCYDNPNALQNELIRSYGISQIDYQMLYAIYGYVNIISPLIAGMMIDWLGIYTSTLGFMVLIVIGQTLWVIACFESVSSFGLMVTGRAIFGVGAEQFHTSRKWLAYEYFTGSEYMLASGLTLSASRFGSATQSYATTQVYESNYAEGKGQKQSIVLSLVVGWVLVIFSLILVAAFTVYQRYYYNNHENEKDEKLSESLTQAANKAEKEKLEKIQLDEVNKDESSKPRTLAVSKREEEWDKHKEQQWNKFQLDALVKCKFDIRFWLFGLTLIFFYSTYLAYSNIGSAFIQSRYQKSLKGGNSLAPIMFWIAAIFTPIQGFICDYFGKRMPFMILASLCLLLGHIFLGFIGAADRSDGYLIMGLIFLGFGYSIGAGACWPCCGIIVPQKYLATALGFWACIDNGFQACCFVIVGELTKVYSKEEYDKLSPNPNRINEFDDTRYFLIALAILTLIWSSLLWWTDAHYFDDILMKPEEKYLVKRGLSQLPTKDIDEEEEHREVNIDGDEAQNGIVTEEGADGDGVVNT